MDVNDQGHLVMMDGSPITVPQLSGYYVGNKLCYITFSFDAKSLPDGRVVVHSALHEGGDPDPKETFLYEVVDRQDAMHCAETMVLDALEYLEACGVHDDENDSPKDFLNRLRADIKNTLH